MTSAISKLLQPQRGENEKFDAYKARRESGNNYVKSLGAGELVWNPQLQGTYKNDDRIRLGKAGAKRAKVARRLTRSKRDGLMPGQVAEAEAVAETVA